MKTLTAHQIEVLKAIHATGLRGLNSFSDFRKDNALQISGTVTQLENMGFKFAHLPQSNKSVTYRLYHVPEEYTHLLKDIGRPIPQEETSGELFAPQSILHRARTPQEIEQLIEAKRREWSEKPERRDTIERFEIPPLKAALRAAKKREELTS